MTAFVGMAAGSSITFATDSWATEKKGDQREIREYSRKLFIVGDRYVVAHRGSVAIAGRNLQASLAQLERAGAAVGSAREIAYMLRAEWVGIGEEGKTAEVYVGGYSGSVGEIWSLEIPAGGVMLRWRTPTGPLGLSSYDSNALIARLLNGRDQRLAQQGELASVPNVDGVLKRFTLGINYSALDATEARTLALTLLRSVIHIQPFVDCVGPEPFLQDAGGLIQVVQLVSETARAEVEHVEP